MARVDNTGGSGFTVDNGTGLVVRTKLNQVIGALSTLNQGSGEMSIGVAAYVPHIDGNTLKIRNAANNAFVSLGDVSLANFGHASLSSANTFTARATFSVTSSITLPSGTTAQRDGSPAVGMIRHNSQTNTFEGYNNGAWGSLSGASGISNVVDDTSPQLGGNLDLQAFELNTSTSNGNLKLNPNGTGVVEVKGDGSSTNGKVQLNCSQNSHGVKLESPDHSASQSYTIKLPDNQIAADKFLKVKSISGSGSTAIGQLEFADGSGGVTSDAQSNTVAGAGAGDSFSGTNAEENSLFGKDAGNGITTGDNNCAFGRASLKDTTTQSNNTAIGHNCLNKNEANNNTGLGSSALAANTTGTSNVAVGANALDANTTANDNTAVGFNSLGANTTGASNTGIGRSALKSNTTASNNTALGFEALKVNTTGHSNVAIGAHAMDENTEGTGNVAVGMNALDKNSTADNNVAIGNNSLTASTTADRNTAVGGNSGFNTTTGSENVMIGYQALYNNTEGSDNIAIGDHALSSNTTANDNTGVGRQALSNNTTGTRNVALGAYALDANTTANDNIAIGYNSLTSNTTGANNCALGKSSLEGNTTGSQNTAFGIKAMQSHSTGDHNTAIGAFVLDASTTASYNTGVGRDALGAVTSGSENTSVGYQAGRDITNGGGNVCLGYKAGRGQITTSNSQLFIARDATGASNAATWIYGGSSGACYQGNNSSSWTTTSDQRLKKDIVTNTVGLSIIDNVTVKNFKYKQYSDGSPVTTDDTVDMSEFPKADNVNQVLIGQGITETQIGIIAQELEAVAPNCVTTNDKGIKTVDTDELFWHMLNAIKELSAKVTALEAG